MSEVEARAAQFREQAGKLREAIALVEERVEVAA